MRPIVIVIKVLLGISLVWMLSIFSLNMIDFDIIKFDTIFLLFESGYRMITFGLKEMFSYLWLGLFLLTGTAFTFTPGFNINFYGRITQYYFDNMFSRWFNLPEDYAWNLNGMADLEVLTGNIYILVFQIIGILMVVYGIMSIIRTDDVPKYCLRTVTFLNLMIIVPLMFLGLQNMIQVFVSDFNLSELLGLYDPEFDPPKLNVIPYPIESDVLFMGISNQFVTFIASPIFQVALAAFVYLELSFQLNYIYQMTSPIEEREARLLYQINSIKSAAAEAVINLKKIEIEEKEKKEEKANKKLEMDEEGNIIEKKKVVSVRQFLSKSATGFSNIKDMIDRRKLEDKAKKRVEALHDTRRLSNYLNKLLSEDKEAEMTLTARSSAPAAGKLIRSTIIDILFRLIGITVLVFVVSQTKWVLINVFTVPPAISESVEMFTAEVILTLLIPIILLFPIISLIIRGSKHQHLRDKLKTEENRRLGIEDEEQELIAA